MYGQLKRAIHLDFHTMPGIYDFNRDWDAAAFAERLEKAHVKYINTFAQCNLGFSYYDTEIGVKYPGMKGDMFGDLLRECHKRDIGVTAYFNLGIDHEACRRHRDWMKVRKDGSVLTGNLAYDHGCRLPCYETGYGEYKYAMVKELIEKYPEVDGIFLDCINLVPCYGNECLEAIKAEGGDPLNDEDVAKHTYNSVMNFCRRIRKLIGNRNLICNSQPYWMMREFNSHVEVECLPGAGGWNYDFFTANASYSRHIKDTVLYMSGRFQSGWGDLGGLKTYASIENDMFDAQMNAVECSIGDHMHPAEIIDEKVYDTIEKVYSNIMTYEPWTDGAKYVPEIGVLCPPDIGFLRTTYHGVARLLGELKCNFDIINETMDLTPYRLIIIPEALRISEALKEKLAAYVASGKRVLSLGVGGLDEKTDAFALPEWNFTFDSMDDYFRAFYKYSDDDFRYATYVPGIKFFANEGAQVIAEYHKAYFNREWDGFHGFCYLPPEKATGHAMAAVSGTVAHIGFNLFTDYNKNSYVAHKHLLKKCMDAVGFEADVTTDLPSTARVTRTETAENILLHIKVTYAENRGESMCIEEHVKYPAGATVKVKGAFTDATLIPSGEKVAAKFYDDHVELTLGQIEGYACIALKKK